MTRAKGAMQVAPAMHGAAVHGGSPLKRSALIQRTGKGLRGGASDDGGPTSG